MRTLPKIMRSGGLKLSDEVVKIKDALPLAPGKIPPKTPLADGPPLDAYDTEILEEASPLVSPLQEEVLQAAMAEAGRILEDAVHKAESQKQEKLAEIQYEAEHIRQNAAEEGRRVGMAEAMDTVRQSAAQLEQAIAAFEGERAGFEAEYEQQLRWLAIEIASKVMAKKVADDDTEMLEMVKKAVQSVRSEPWVRIEVAQEMVRLIDRLTALYEGDGSVTVGPIPAESGTVHVETPSGVVDASLHTQLANLRDYFAQAGT